MVKVLMPGGGIVTFTKGTHYGLGDDGSLFVYEAVAANPTEAVAVFRQWEGVWNTAAVALALG